MSLEIDVNGRACVPLAAIPFITGGRVSCRTVILALAMPQLFGERYGGNLIDAFEFLPFGRATYLSRDRIERIASTCAWDRLEPPLNAIGGVVVSQDDLTSAMDALVTQTPESQNGLAGQLPWNPDPELPIDVSVAIFKALPITLSVSRVRKNDRRKRHDAIEGAVATIEDRVKSEGHAFDRTGLLGRKQDLIRLIQHLDPTLQMAESTYDTYFKELQLRWRPGGRQDQVVAWFAVFGVDLG